MKAKSTNFRALSALKKILYLQLLMAIALPSLAQDKIQLNRTKQEAVLKSENKIASYTFDKTLNTPNLVLMKPESKFTKAQSQGLIQTYFGLTNAGDAVQLDNETTTPYGITVVKYHQYYNNIKVEQGAYSVVIKNNEIQSIVGESYLTTTNNLISNATLNERQALQKCLDFTRADVYLWEAMQMDLAKITNPSLKKKLTGELQKILPNGELVYCRDVYGDQQAHLSYKFEINTFKPLGKYLIYVDAVNEKILYRDAIIKHAGEINEKNKNNIAYTNAYKGFKSTNNVAIVPIPNSVSISGITNGIGGGSFTQGLPSVLGTAKTRYAGTRKIYTQKVTVPINDPNDTIVPLQYSGVDPRIPVLSGDVYILSDNTRGKGIATFDLNAVGGAPVSLPAAIYSTALAFVDKDNNWKDEAVGSNTNEDLMRGTTQPPNPNGDPQEPFNDDIAIDAHWGAGIVYDYWGAKHGRKSYDNANATINSFVHDGVAYDNAFWNGTVMTYGDGMSFRPLTSLDVCGHEIGHGVCQYTANLVYAGESGGMNEGLSDIWASCIENFALQTVDNTLPYQVFQVGEQIDPANEGLRRQDNPKRYLNPDTYNGLYWTTTTGCTPTLANDECGVHNNSGVLNKWFYLLVRGPKATTGLPTFTDDGIADAGTTAALENKGNNYGLLAPIALGGTNEFLPLGFDDAEKITYLMELTMPASSTYADARIYSIQAAISLFGPCSQQVITTTDAWYAVGVGAKWAGCTAPTVNVVTTAPSTTLTEFAIGGCGRYTDYTINAALNVGQATPTTINFSTSGTATLNKDFALTANSITYNAGETGIKSISLRIFDDAVVEGDETVNLTATSTLTALNKTINFTIADDDIIPVIGSGIISLMNENFESTTSGSLPTGWSTLDQITPSPVSWKVRSAPTVSVLAFTTKRLIIEMPLVTGQALYDQNTSASTLVKTKMINAVGLNTVNVQFTYSAGGEGSPTCNPACDYGALKYSFDGTNFYDVSNMVTPLNTQITDSTYNVTLPALFNNKQFYLGFQWINDANAGTSTSVTIDNLVVTAKGRQVEGDLADNTSETMYAEGAKPSYLYSSNDGQIMIGLSNISQDLGCVNTNIKQAGTGVIAFSQGSRSEKVFEVIPTINSTTASYTITLYYKTAELSSWGSAKPNLKIIKSDAATIDASNGTNSVIVTPQYADFATAGYTTYTGTFTGFSKFALVSPSAVLPVIFIDFTVTTLNNALLLNWKTGGNGVVNNYIIERRVMGVGDFVEIGRTGVNGNNIYTYTDNSIDLNTVYEYRIRQVDVTNSITYSPTKTGTVLGKHILEMTVTPIPIIKGSNAIVKFNNSINNMQLQIVSINGSTLNSKQIFVTANSGYEINTAQLPAGTYYIKAIGKDDVIVKKLIIQ